DPVQPHYLRIQVGSRSPLRPQHRNVLFSLEAVAVEPTSGDVVMLVHPVVDLDNEVVHPVLVRKSRIDLRRARRVGADVHREQTRESAIAGKRSRADQIGAERVHCETVALNAGDRVGNAAGRIASERYGCRSGNQVRVAYDRAYRFIGAKEEGSVLDDRAADAEPELMLSKRLLRQIVGVEEVAGIQRVVPMEVVETSVKAVCAGLEPEVDNC